MSQLKNITVLKVLLKRARLIHCHSPAQPRLELEVTTQILRNMANFFLVLVF